MYFYRIAELTVESDRELSSYKAFACEAAKADVTVTVTDEFPPPGPERISGMMAHRKLADGWFFHPVSTDRRGLYISEDYSRLRRLGAEGPKVMGIVDESEWYIRIAMECLLARKGYLSLHAAAVEVRGEAFVFSGPSGMGKSTRAGAWGEAFGAELINGDRPLIDTGKMEVYGVPWDGKEQCFRNVCYPLKAIFEVRRCGMNYIRAMSLEQKRNLLLRQCFIPMFDVETAAIQITNITRLAKTADIVRLFGGPNAEDARALRSALQDHQYLKEETDMKAKSGFVLRNIVDEYILMPTGDNISKFKGTVLLNEVSAFVWEQLETPISKEDLLNAVLSEFEVERAVAAADLDALLEKLRGYGVIEDD